MARNNSYQEENEMQAKELKLRKKFQHEKWLKRQSDFHKIIERDCYGYKKN